MLEMDRLKLFTADGLPQVNFVQKYIKQNPFTLMVTREGLRQKGNMIGELKTHAELQSFAKAISTAWEEFRALQLESKKGTKDEASLSR